MANISHTPHRTLTEPRISQQNIQDACKKIQIYKKCLENLTNSLRKRKLTDANSDMKLTSE
jgi:hypothetical protein